MPFILSLRFESISQINKIIGHIVFILFPLQFSSVEILLFSVLLASVGISSSESFLRGGHKPSISVHSEGDAVHVFINGQFVGM